MDLQIQLSKTGGPATGTTVLTVDETAPFDCADGTVTTGPLTMTPLDQSHDVDYWAAGQTAPDGCTTWEELGTNQNAGGLRDPFNFWDFFDVPTGAYPNLQRDKAITTGDVAAITNRFGAHDSNGTAPINRYSDPTSAPPASPAYHPAYDRSAVLLGPNGWNLDAADGAIVTGDINYASGASFGHTCIAAP